ncbi:ATP-binding protein [Streptomyces lasalocidi]
MIQESVIPNFTVLLSPTPRGARLARLLAVQQLRDWQLPLDAAEHIVAELAANAVTYGKVTGRDFRLTLYVVGATLRIEVADTRGDRLPRAQPPLPTRNPGADCTSSTHSPTAGESPWDPPRARPSGPRSPSRHRSTGARAPVRRAVLPKDVRG